VGRGVEGLGVWHGSACHPPLHPETPTDLVLLALHPETPTDLVLLALHPETPTDLVLLALHPETPVTTTTRPIATTTRYRSPGHLARIARWVNRPVEGPYSRALPAAERPTGSCHPTKDTKAAKRALPKCPPSRAGENRAHLLEIQRSGGDLLARDLEAVREVPAVRQVEPHNSVVRLDERCVHLGTARARAGGSGACQH
jgi:hypothetical protein